MRNNSWAQLCHGWDIQAGVENKFLLSGHDVTYGYRVSEVTIEGQVFVRELSAYMAERNLTPATALQGIKYGLANLRAQFDHPLVICGKGGLVLDQNDLPQVLYLSCTAGNHAIFIHRQAERLDRHVRLLVLDKAS